MMAFKWRIRRILRLMERLEVAVFGEHSGSIMRYNSDKPHRCPECHAVTDPDHLSATSVVSCCRCGCSFTRFPRLAFVLRFRGVVCPGHQRGER